MAYVCYWGNADITLCAGMSGFNGTANTDTPVMATYGPIAKNTVPALLHRSDDGVDGQALPVLSSSADATRVDLHGNGDHGCYPAWRPCAIAWL